MADFNETDGIPKWRTIFWGVLTAVLIDTFFYFFRQIPGTQPPPLTQYLMGPVCGVIISIIVYRAVSIRAKRDQILNSQDSANLAQSDRTPRQTAIGTKILLCLLGSLFLFVAALGIYNGHISVGRHTHHEVYRTQDPGLFWFNVLFYAAGGGYMFYRAFRPQKE